MTFKNYDKICNVVTSYSCVHSSLNVLFTPLVMSQLGNSTQNEHHYNTRERIDSSPLWVKHEKKTINILVIYPSFISNKHMLITYTFLFTEPKWGFC